MKSTPMGLDSSSTTVLPFHDSPRTPRGSFSRTAPNVSNGNDDDDDDQNCLILLPWYASAQQKPTPPPTAAASTRFTQTAARAITIHTAATTGMDFARAARTDSQPNTDAQQEPAVMEPLDQTAATMTSKSQRERSSPLESTSSTKESCSLMKDQTRG